MCVETLKLFNMALTKANEGGAPHCPRTIVDTLHSVVMGRVPRRARLTRVLQRSRMSNQMGSKGKQAITFSEALLFELEQSG